jgi:hypothetical protein
MTHKIGMYFLFIHLWFSWGISVSNSGYDCLGFRVCLGLCLLKCVPSGVRTDETGAIWEKLFARQNIRVQEYFPKGICIF